MGKSSLLKIETDDIRRRIRDWKKKLKPPYPCPKCFQEEAVFAEKKTTFLGMIGKKPSYKYVFTLWCKNKCFSMSLVYNSPAKEYIDAYCEVIDLFLKKVIEQK